MPDLSHQRTTTYEEWRICGYSDARGPWEGAWRRERESDYEIQRYKNRNAQVWLERRKVTVTPTERVDV